MLLKWIIMTCLIHNSHSVYNSEIDKSDIRAVSRGNNSVRGYRTYTGQYPFQVIFYEKEPRDSVLGPLLSPICSGAIISNRWVLTTVTPLGMYPIGSYFMLAGRKNIPSDSKLVMDYEDKYLIDTIVIHPDWQERRQNNVAMARTSKTLILEVDTGILRIPPAFVPPNDTSLICSMNIWASGHARENLLGHYQDILINKQTLYFKVANGTEVCPDIIFDDATLCLVQMDPNHLKDVCAVNFGSIVHCKCGSVGMFYNNPRRRSSTGCVDQPPLKYTAANLVFFRDWLMKVNDAEIPGEYDTHKISVASCIELSYNLVFLIGLFFK